VITPYIDSTILQTMPSQLPNVFTQGKPLIWGSVNGAIYLFGYAGDVIEDHAHSAGTSHMIIVLYGTVTYSLTNTDGSVTNTDYSAPSIIIVPDDLVHSVTAVSPPNDSSGPNPQDLNTISALTFHQTMSTIKPANIIAQINKLTTPVQNLITQLNNALALTKTTAP